METYLNKLEENLAQFQFCGKRQEGIKCPFQEDLTNTSSYELDQEHSIVTLPKIVNFRKLGTSENGYGVWSNTKIPKGIRFGPYEGDLIYEQDEAHQTDCSIQVLNSEHPDHFNCTRKEYKANWLNYINFASNQQQQNLIILRCNGQTYYQTIENILPDTELLAWYDSECAPEFGTINHENMFQISINLKIKERDTPKEIIRLDDNLQIHSAGGNNSKFQNYHSHKENGLYSCHFCQRKFKTGNRFARHNCTQFRVKKMPYACDICGRGFRQKSTVKLHKNIHVRTEKKSYACERCGKIFRQKDTLELHMNIHAFDKSYICSICNKKFATDNEFGQHKKTHTERMLYNCDVCGQKFTEPTSLSNHKITHIEENLCNVPVYIVSENKFSTDISLVQQQNTYEQVKSYNCVVCDGTFARKSNFKKHNSIYTDVEKPYHCNKCGMRFAHKKCFKRHLKLVHTIPNCYNCDVCRKKFPTINSLQNHNQIHVEKIFKDNFDPLLNFLS